MTTTQITHAADGSITMTCPADSLLAAHLGAMGSYAGTVDGGNGTTYQVDPTILINDDDPQQVAITYWLRPVVVAEQSAEPAE